MAKKDKATKQAQSESDVKIQGVIDRVVNNEKRQPNWEAFSDLVVKNGGPRISADHVGIVLTAYKFYQGSPEAVEVRQQVSQSVEAKRAEREQAREADAAKRAEAKAAKDEAAAKKAAAAEAKASKTTAAAASKPKGKAGKATPAASAGKATAKKAASKGKGKGTKAAF
jgi:hypothetical protein